MARLQYLLITAITSRTFQMHDPREKQWQLNEQMVIDYDEQIVSVCSIIIN